MTTIYDIAKQVGVSAATVSNAFNRPHLLRSETLNKIKETAIELDYRPNAFASALKGSNSKLVSIMMPDLRVPYSANVVQGIENVLGTRDYVTFISNMSFDEERAIKTVDSIYRQGVRAFIWVPIPMNVTEKLLTKFEQLAKKNCRILIVSRPSPSGSIGSIYANNYESAKKIVQYLLSLGHRRIAFLGVPQFMGNEMARFRGYREAIEEAGLAIDDKLIRPKATTIEASHWAATQLFDSDGRPSAIFAINDLAAQGVLLACYERKIRLPDDLSLVSFDIGSPYQVTAPRVTSMEISAEKMGERAAHELLILQDDAKVSPRHIKLEYTLKLHQTTGFPSKPISSSRE